MSESGDTAVTLQDIEREFTPKFDELNGKVEEFSTNLEKAKAEGDDAKVTEISKAMEDLDETVKTLSAERDERMKEAEYKSLQNEVVTIRKALEEARKPNSDFTLAGGVPVEEQSDVYGSDKSFYVDAKKAISKNDGEALERWEEAMVEKAMTSAQGTTGGFLVPPQISGQLLELREQNNVLRGLFSSISVSSDTLRIAAVTKGMTAGWVAELAEKPQSDLEFGELSVNVFTKAGLGVVSNQLLQDSNPSVDSLINRDLAKRLAALEEIAFIDGSGVGQPQGILNTEDIGTTPLSSTNVDDLLDAVIDAITAIYTDYFGAPNAILMHPRTWGRIVKERNPDYASQYIIGPPANRTSTDSLPGFGQGANPTGQLFGLPVYTTRNVPTDKGPTDNESRVIVGAFDEGLILDHSDITLDSSEHVYFTSNQTIFRAEDRVGFTAARYPKAFNVIGGSGLAAG